MSIPQIENLYDPRPSIIKQRAAMVGLHGLHVDNVYRGAALVLFVFEFAFKLRLTTSQYFYCLDNLVWDNLRGLGAGPNPHPFPAGGLTFVGVDACDDFIDLIEAFIVFFGYFDGLL